MTKSVERIHEIAQLYDVFLVDQFGVLHDGRQAYAGASDALRSLQATGKTVIIISNSGKRAGLNQARLNRLGFDNTCFTAVVSSGEVGWHLLQQAQTSGEIAADGKCYVLSTDNDLSGVEGLGLSVVDDSADADIVLLSGLGKQRDSLASYERRLKPALDRGVTCFCTNPDKIALTASGKQFSVGTIADRYVALGGKVVWIGKPYAEIYRFIQANYSLSDESCVLCVGDSVEHDIAGGAAMGFDTALVRTGVLDNLDEEAMRSLFEQHNCYATYTLPGFY